MGAPEVNLGVDLFQRVVVVTEKPPESTRTAKKRCAILGAAVEEFEANGFQCTSMDRVAERANVSKRTIYNHFESKEALFQAITEELVDRIERVTEIPYDASRSLKLQLEEIGHRKIDLMTCPGFLSLAKVTISELLRNPNLASDTYCRIHREEAGLVRWIRAAAEDGRLDVSAPAEAAEQFSALLSAFAFWPLIFGRPAPVKAKLAEIVSSAAVMFLAHYANDNRQAPTGHPPQGSPR